MAFEVVRGRRRQMLASEQSVECLSRNECEYVGDGDGGALRGYVEAIAGEVVCLRWILLARRWSVNELEPLASGLSAWGTYNQGMHDERREGKRGIKKEDGRMRSDYFGKFGGEDKVACAEERCY